MKIFLSSFTVNINHQAISRNDRKCKIWNVFVCFIKNIHHIKSSIKDFLRTFRSSSGVSEVAVEALLTILALGVMLAVTRPILWVTEPLTDTMAVTLTRHTGHIRPTVSGFTGIPRGTGFAILALKNDSWKFQLKYRNCIWKWCLQNISHFIQASVCSTEIRIAWSV